MKRHARLFRCSARAVSVGLAIVAVMLATACTTPLDNTLQPGMAAADSAVELRLTAICAALAWKTCRSDLRTDEQKLDDGENEYGPLAFAVPGTEVDNQINFLSNGMGVLTAAVWVDTSAISGPVPVTYTNLGLVKGYNCIYLRLSNGAWGAAIKPGNTTSPICDPAFWATQPLKVYPVSSTAQPVPGVIRFHEGRLPGRKGQPLVGMKCGTAWCIILPDIAGADTVKMPRPEGTASQKWLNYGWGDAQHLAVLSGTELKYGVNMSASIAVDDNLGNIPTSEVPAATVFFADDPEGSDYGKVWLFREGANPITIKKVGDKKYKGWLKTKKKVLGINVPWKKELRFTYKHYDPVMPVTARFHWDAADEGLWVRCDDGCCKVSGN